MKMFVCELDDLSKLECFPGGGGVLAVYMTGRSNVFFWVENLHPRYFFGSRDLSCIFLGLKVCLIE